MINGWGNMNPYEKLLWELIPEMANKKKEVKAMTDHERMNQMKKGQLVKVTKFPNDIWRIEAFDYSHHLVGARSINKGSAILRWFAPEELNTDIRQERRLDGYPAYCEAVGMATDYIIREYAGNQSIFIPRAKKVIYNEAAGVTVVLWADGTKTVVRAAEGEEHDAYLGYCVALTKKMHGTNSALKRNLKKVLVVREDKKLEITGSMAELAPADEENK